MERMREEVAESAAEAHERLTEIGLSARTERKRPGGGEDGHLPHCEADEWKPPRDVGRPERTWIASRQAIERSGSLR